MLPARSPGATPLAQGFRTTMIQDDLFEILDATLPPLGAVEDIGEEFRDPPLDVLRYHHRKVRLSRFPILGRGLSVIAVVRQPVDLPFTREGFPRLLRRVSLAVNARFPPIVRGHGLSIGLTSVILTPEPIQPTDDDLLAEALKSPAHVRTVPIGLFRLNLGQEAMAMSLTRGPQGVFPEPEALAEALTRSFQRFVPPIDA